MKYYFFLKNINKRSLSLVLVFTFALALFSSCNEEPAITPKPRGFPKVVYPEKEYQAFNGNYCDFIFEFPKYAVIEKEKTFFGELPDHQCWFDIFVPQYDARIHCTYSPIDEKGALEKLKADAFELAHKHNIKAKYIEEIQLNTSHGAKGFAFNLEGDVASPFQFYLTDEEKHFMRGSLYFNTAVAPDSLAPIFSFLEKDIQHLINTLEWK